jgi:uncharacterized protein YceK
MTPSWSDTLKFITSVVILLAVFGGLIALLSGCTTVVKWKCPPLSPAPESTLDVLALQARKDPNTATWVIDLDKHYQKCDIINSSKG